MANNYAAKIEDGTVVQVIVGTSEWAQSRLGGEWHDSDKKVGIGWSRDENCGFIPPRPYPSWTLVDCVWTAPVPQPEYEGPWSWDEENQEWTIYADELA